MSELKATKTNLNFLFPRTISESAEGTAIRESTMSNESELKESTHEPKESTEQAKDTEQKEANDTETSKSALTSSEK